MLVRLPAILRYQAPSRSKGDGCVPKTPGCQLEDGRSTRPRQHCQLRNLQVHGLERVLDCSRHEQPLGVRCITQPSFAFSSNALEACSTPHPDTRGVAPHPPAFKVGANRLSIPVFALEFAALFLPAFLAWLRTCATEEAPGPISFYFLNIAWSDSQTWERIY